MSKAPKAKRNLLSKSEEASARRYALVASGMKSLMAPGKKIQSFREK